MPAPHHSFFYRPDALSDAQTTVSKHWRHVLHAPGQYKFHFELELERITHLGAVTLESLHGLAVKSLAVHLSSSTVVLLLRIIRDAAMLMEEWQLDTAETKHITNTRTLSNCSIKQKLQTKTTTVCLTALYPGRSGWASTRRNMHSLTPCLCGCYTTSLINFLHLLRFIASSLHIFVGSDNLFLWPHSKFSLACLYVLHLPLQNPCIFHPMFLVLS